MDKMKRFKKGVLDGFRSSAAAPKSELEIEESLRAEHFQVCKTVRHGFPFQPTSVAYDPVQHILAIGTKTGSLRIFGRPGVDCHCCHTEEVAVIQILFLVNEGALVTVCSDDTLHLWNYRQKRPEIVHTLKFLKERITYCHLPFQSKWLYAGTERGNVHVVNIESFFLSGYVINWNKAIELSRKTHPGPVVHLSDNPLDPNRLLIGFESGTVVLWDLKSKTAEYRYSTPEALRSISWYHDGKQFMCSHSDGSLTTWNCKTPLKPMNVLLPHAKIGKDGKPDPCKPITKVEWKSVRNGEPLVIFSGGMSYDKAGRTPSITVMNGKSTTVLEMEHNVVDFVVLCETPWVNEFQEPYAIVVLLQNDLVVVDLTVQGYPCFENPYPMDIHESPVTACQYYADCPPELIPAFYSVGSKQKKSGFSEKGWPIKGGEWGTTTCSYPEIIVTGHADGSLKFWDASAVTLQVLYKVKTAKIFEKPKCKNSDGQDEDPFAIQIIRLCPESRVLCVAGGTHVMLFLFSKQEITLEVPSMEIQIIYEVYDDLESPDYEYPKPTLGAVHQKSESFGSYSSSASDSTKETYTALKVKSGQRRWSPGYHPELVCLLSYIDSEHPGNITSISVNSTYGLIAFGNESGLAIVDYSQKSCLLNLGTPDLYGSMDPYQRAPRSPRGKRPQPQEAANTAPYTEECKSPTSDQPLSQQSPTSPSVVYQSKKRSSLTEPGLVAIDETDTCLPHDINDNNNTKTLAQRTSVKSALHMSKENLLGHKTLRKMSAVDSQEFNSKLPTFRSKSDAFTKKNLKKILRRSSSDTELETVTKEKTCDNQTEPKSAEILNVVSSPVICDCNSKNNNMLLSSPNENNNFKVGLRLVSGTDSKTLACYRQSETVDGIGKSLFRKMSLTIKSITTKVRGYGFGDEEHESNRARSRRRFGDVGKVDVVDLTDDYRKPSVKRHVSRSEIFHGMLIDKNDGSSFSRSRSSSMSSLENVSKEAIQRLLFADSYTRKTDNSTCPCLWVGTSLGSVLVIVLSLPPNGDQRLNQPVIVSPSGTIFRLKGSILNMSFLDCNGVLIPTVSEQWKDTSKDNKEDKRESQRPRQTSTSNYKPKISPTTSTEMSDRQFAIICSEKQARVMSLPSQTCAYKVKITETSFVVCSDIVSIKDSVCLVCYVANGHIMTFSLPSLKLLMDALFQPLTNIRVARTFCFSNNGHALYLCSPTEVQKITYSAEFSENLNEMLGDLFLPCDTPEAPKQSFFKNLFSGGGSTVDREELFGETSGKASKGLARVIAGSGGMQHLTAQSGSVASEVARTRQALFERGEKLEGLDDKTAMMATEAESYAQVAHQIMLKYKDKKWYQF